MTEPDDAASAASATSSNAAAGATAPARPAPTAPAAAGGAGDADEEAWSTRYKYLLADFENFRRRTERERESHSRQTRGALLRELLPIYEAFHFAHEAVQKLPENDPVRQGLDLLLREWETFLRHEGVEPVARAGAPFEPEVHEAVGEVPASATADEGQVAEVVQQGYRFHGGVLRPAKVLIARRAPPRGTDAGAAAEKEGGT